MTKDKSDKEKFFEEYRESLHQEIRYLASFITLFRHLYDKRCDRIKELNIAPAFFQTVEHALFTGIIHLSCNLFDRKANRGERGFKDFLIFVEKNIVMFSIEALRKRRDKPDDYWFSRQKSITLVDIQNHRDKIANFVVLRHISTRRNKRYGHFDKEYFLDKDRLHKETPIKWGELDEIKDLASDILTTYSVAYDGSEYFSEPTNIKDIDIILNILHKRNEERKEE